MAQTSPKQVNVTIAPMPGTHTQAQNGEGGTLLENPPGNFSGDRSKAQKFLDTINIWRAVNYKKEIMRDPFTCTALILTYIKGENVDNWVKHQLIKLLNKEWHSLEGLPSEDWWDDFVQDFRDAFTFTVLKEMALVQLKKLTMGKDGIDTYIATFNGLLDEAEFSWCNKGAIEMFKWGLNLWLKINCIKRKPRPVTMDKWQEAAWEEQCKYLKIQQALGHNPYNIKEWILNTPQKKPTTKFWKAKGPDAMEVNTNELAKANFQKGQPQRNKLTKEEKAALWLLKLCFYCQGKGHTSATCPEKPVDQRQDREHCQETKYWLGHCPRPLLNNKR